jgi:hypothetical protein
LSVSAAVLIGVSRATVELVLAHGVFADEAIYTATLLTAIMAIGALGTGMTHAGGPIVDGPRPWTGWASLAVALVAGLLVAAAVGASRAVGSSGPAAVWTAATLAMGAYFATPALERLATLKPVTLRRRMLSMVAVGVLTAAAGVVMSGMARSFGTHPAIIVAGGLAVLAPAAIWTLGRLGFESAPRESRS